MRIAGDEALGRALVAAGGEALRHAHLMSHDLSERPPLPDPPGYRLTDVDRPAADLMDAFRAAYPPGHSITATRPYEHALATLDDYLSGRAFGPLLRGSGLAVDRDGAVAGGHPDRHAARRPAAQRTVADRAVPAPRAPRRRPRAARARPRARRRPALGLLVTEGNPAGGYTTRSASGSCIPRCGADLTRNARSSAATRPGSSANGQCPLSGRTTQTSALRERLALALGAGGRTGTGRARPRARARARSSGAQHAPRPLAGADRRPTGRARSTARRVAASKSSYMRSTNSAGRPRGLPSPQQHPEARAAWSWP